MRASLRRWAAPLTVVISVATGIVTNLITSAWTWTLAVTLAALVICGAILATVTSSTGETNIIQRATHGGTIQRSPIRARGAKVKVTQTAHRSGTIEDSGIDAQ